MELNKIKEQDEGGKKKENESKEEEAEFVNNCNYNRNSFSSGEVENYNDNNLEKLIKAVSSFNDKIILTKMKKFGLSKEFILKSNKNVNFDLELEKVKEINNITSGHSNSRSILNQAPSKIYFKSNINYLLKKKILKNSNLKILNNNDSHTKITSDFKTI